MREEMREKLYMYEFMVLLCLIELTWMFTLNVRLFLKIDWWRITFPMHGNLCKVLIGNIYGEVVFELKQVGLYFIDLNSPF